MLSRTACPSLRRPNFFSLFFLMMNMKFFTNDRVNNPFLLIKLQAYLHRRPFPRKKEVFIDPGVYELKKRKKYRWEGAIPISKFLDSLPAHHFFSYDFPPDMQPSHTAFFLQRTWEEAQNFHTHPQYIVTVQSRFKDYKNFTKWFDKYNALDIESGILGLGNFCRIHYLTEFVRHALSYAFKNCNHERIHIYGPALRYIPFAYKLSRQHGIILSIDSMKWTRPVREEMKDEYGGVSCKEEHREAYFQAYKKILRDRGVTLEI